MNIYYVYAYIRSKDSTTAKAGTPYYIGKGKNGRAFVKHNNTKTPKDKSKIIILENNLTEVGALAIERRLIRWFGRKNLGTGILHNRTDGGEGISGVVGVIRTSAQRKKISAGKRGKKLGPQSAEHRKNMSLSLTGKIKAPETLLKLSAPKQKFTCDTCGKTVGGKNNLNKHIVACLKKKAQCI